MHCLIGLFELCLILRRYSSDTWLLSNIPRFKLSLIDRRKELEWSDLTIRGAKIIIEYLVFSWKIKVGSKFFQA